MRERQAAEKQSGGLGTEITWETERERAGEMECEKQPLIDPSRNELYGNVRADYVMLCKHFPACVSPVF